MCSLSYFSTPIKLVTIILVAYLIWSMFSSIMPLKCRVICLEHVVCSCHTIYLRLVKFTCIQPYIYVMQMFVMSYISVISCNHVISNLPCYIIMSCHIISSCHIFVI